MSTPALVPARTSPGHPREPALGACLLLAALGLAFVALTHPGALAAHLPRAASPQSDAWNLRDLRALLLLEAVLLGALAAVAALRGEWLGRPGVLSRLERHPRRILALLLLLHMLSALFYFAPHDIASPDPVVSCDNAYHFAQVVTASHMLDDAHHVWGYSPWFMAGYPAGVIFDLDMKGAELFCDALEPLGLQYAFKMYILLSMLVFPFAVYGGARLFRLRPGEALVAVLWALLYWHWGRPLVGQLKWSGMHSFLFASCLTVLSLGIFQRFLDSDPGRRRMLWVGLVPLVAMACQIHPLAGLMLGPGFLLAYLAALGRLRGRDHVALWVGLALVLAASSDWVLPYLRFRQYKTPSNFWFQLHGMHDVVFFYTRKTAVIFTAITLLGVGGLFEMRRRSGLAAITVGTSAAAYFLAGFFGSRVPYLDSTEPGRYLVPFTFLMSVPAALGLAAAWRGLRRVAPRLARPEIARLGLLLASSAMPLLSLADNRIWEAHALSTEIDPHFRALVAFLRENTTRDGRILFETPGGYHNQSKLLYGGHLQALVPFYTDREVIGGPYPVSFLVHAAVDFENGELLGRRLGTWEPAEFARFLDTYNIGWIVCWSDTARAYFDARADLVRPLGEFGVFRVYALPRPAGWLLAGRGLVTASYNRIEVSGASGDELVLKYHWLESLRATPPVPLERYPIPGDPVGFIRLRPGGASHLVIRNVY